VFGGTRPGGGKCADSHGPAGRGAEAATVTGGRRDTYGFVDGPESGLVWVAIHIKRVTSLLPCRRRLADPNHGLADVLAFYHHHIGPPTYRTVYVVYIGPIYRPYV